MIGYALNALLSLFLLAVLLWTLSVLWQVAYDNHQRGMARVHRGTSWSKRGVTDSAAGITYREGGVPAAAHSPHQEQA